MIKNIIVSGSLAYDRIMDFPGYFTDHILPEKIHILNVSFTLERMTEKFGGTAGNIAYALSMLDETPLIQAAIGHDYSRYFEWLGKNRISTQGINIIHEESTAGAYIITDKADNQITGFNPGAMKYSSSFDFNGMSSGDSIMIVAPGNLEDMKKYSKICKEKHIEYIFDPGQSLPMWDSLEMISCIEGSKILITNDYELEMIISKTGLDKRALLSRVKVIITTLGEKGSCVATSGSEICIPAATPKKVVDPTGAGDAYRAGLIKGLIQGKDIEYCAMMGGVCASFAVENYGTQEYRFTLEEYNERLNDFLAS